MNRRLVGAAALTATVAALAWWSYTAPADAPPPAQAARLPQLAREPEARQAWAIPASEPEAARPDSPLLPIDQSRSASDSLAAAGFDGDERAPRLVRSQTWRETPTPWELSDPKAYQQYETRQNQRLAASYIKATDTALPELKSDIERGRRQGIDPKEIAQAEEKLRRMAAMREELRGKYPELAESASSPASDTVKPSGNRL